MVVNGYSYIQNLGIAVDQLFSALLGYPCDLTLSALFQRWHMKGKRSWPRKLTNMLFFWQDDHCETAYKSEMDRLHLPADMRLKRLDEE